MKKVNLEILISTMNRTDLTFLEPMFPNRDLSDFHVLIINQTTLGNELESKESNIRVINSFEYGLSKSRNLALENSIGEVALIADDDIIYLPEFDNIVLYAFQKYPNASLISFQILDKDDLPFKKYNNKERKVESLKFELAVFSFEIGIRPFFLRKKGIKFNENFGLRSEFYCCEETLFLDSILKNGSNVYHFPKLIVKHDHPTTGNDQGDPRFIQAKSASKYLQYGNWVYLWLAKFVFFLARHEFISIWEIGWVCQTGLRAIKRSKEIVQSQDGINN